jgi:nitrogen-specific signal transduction histidine kinase
MKWISPIKATINQFIAMSSAQSHEELQRRICELESKLSVFEANPHNLPHEELEYKNMIQHMLHEVHYWEVVRDDRGKIRSWKLINANLAAIKSWGVSLSDVVGKNAEEIFRDGDPLGQFMPIVEKIISEQKPHIWEQYFPGTNQVLQMVSIPHGDRFISTGLDVTKQKKMEDALNHSRKMDSIAQLANGISHEFNNQLTVMMGYADLLLEKLKDEELKAYVTGIRHTAFFENRTHRANIVQA